MAADFTTYKDLKKKWMLAGIAATLVMVLIIPLSFFKSWQRISKQKNQGIKNISLFV